MARVPRTVDVWLARQSLASLRPPTASIVDGSQTVSVVRTCCLRASGVSRLTVSLPVDDATARRFARSCRREMTWQRVGLPVVCTIAALGLVPAVIGVVRYDFGLLLLAGLVELCLAAATILIRTVLLLQRSRHHPVLAGRGHVVVRGVDGQTARAWADLNPGGLIELHG